MVLWMFRKIKEHYSKYKSHAFSCRVNLTNFHLLTAAYTASGVIKNKNFIKDGTFEYFAQPLTASDIPLPELWDDNIYISIQSLTS